MEQEYNGQEYNEVLHRYYTPSDCVFFENLAQSNAYIFRGGAEVQAILDSKAHPGRFIFAFLKEDHYRLRDAWRDHTL